MAIGEVSGMERRADEGERLGESDVSGRMCDRDAQPVRLYPTPSRSMPLELSTVAIVIDPDFGAALQSLASRMPVWVADTPGNRVAIEAEWTRRRRDGAEREVTVFRMIDGLTAAEHVSALLATIEAHHGQGAQDPPFEVLEVVGAEPDAAMTAAIRSAGGTDPVATPTGFRAAFPRSRATRGPDSTN